MRPTVTVASRSSAAARLPERRGRLERILPPDILLAGASPGQLTVTYRHDDRTGHNAYQKEQAVKKLLLLSGPPISVTFLPYRRRHPQDEFHDRLVNIIAAAADAMHGRRALVRAHRRHRSPDGRPVRDKGVLCQGRNHPASGRSTAPRTVAHRIQAGGSCPVGLSGNQTRRRVAEGSRWSVVAIHCCHSHQRWLPS